MMTTTNDTNNSIANTIEFNVRQYFQVLDGESTTSLYDLIISQVEKPLLSVVLEHTNGNQSKSAEILGLNRGTLRKKLIQHQLLN